MTGDLTRRSLLGGIVSCAAFSAVRGTFAASGAPRLRIGLLSDTHITEDPKSIELTRLALKLFKAKEADVVAHLGDLADWHYPKSYGYYRRAVDEVFPPEEKRPRLVYAFGDHDALEPARKKGPRSNRIEDREKCWADMKERLAIEHGYNDTLEIGGLPFLVFPQTVSLSLGYEEYEKRIAAACAKHPTGPVFVLEHEPARGVCYNTNECDGKRREILEKFPRVVQLSGHKHATVFNELSLWQGRFTAIQVSCLQSWYGLNVGERVRGKPTRGVMVMEVFDDRLEVRRYDVLDGREYRPERPWIVPFAAPMPKRTDGAFSFAADARPSACAVGSPADRIEITFPQVEAAGVENVFFYRVESWRRGTGTEWEKFARKDVFGEFYLSPSERKTSMTATFFAETFDSGMDVRFTVTPVGFFGTEGKPIVCEWKAPGAFAGIVLWESTRPAEEAKWTSSANKASLLLPIPKEKSVGRLRFMVEVAIDQPGALQGAAFGVTRATWAGGLLTAKEEKIPLRYVLEENLRTPPNSLALNFSGAARIKICLQRVKIVAL